MSTDAECACVAFRHGTAWRAWVIQGTKLSVGGTSWLDTDEVRTVEMTAAEQ